MKNRNIKDFTDHELIEELRNRKYALDIWCIGDVDQVIEDMKEDFPEEFSDLELPYDSKYEIIRDLFENNDKTFDFEMINERIREQWKKTK